MLAAGHPSSVDRNDTFSMNFAPHHTGMPMNSFADQQQQHQQQQQQQQYCMDSNNNNNGMMGAYRNNTSIISSADSHDSLCGIDQDLNNNNIKNEPNQNHMKVEEDENSNNFNDFTSKTNLIVNYLPQNMTQDEIKALFANIGPVDSCKLIKDKLTEGQSLGYAFVNYVKQEDAATAMSTLNGMKLQNKTIKVSYARPSSESIKGANLYVCGLSKDFTQNELEKMFTPFGQIISSKILLDSKTGLSKGVGFVRFDQRCEAEIAINKLNGTTLQDEMLVVKFANSPTTVKSVMGLPINPFASSVRGFYQPYRQTNNANYRYSPMNGYCPDNNLLQQQQLQQQHQQPTNHQQQNLLTGMLTPPNNNNNNNSNNLTVPLAYQSNSSMPMPSMNALVQQSMSNTNLMGGNGGLMNQVGSGASTHPAMNMPASLSTSSLSSINYSGWCIFVYNLGPETDESLLWQLFGPFGAVQSVKIIRDAQTHKCKGFGFVTMTNYEEAVTAIGCLNGLNLQNRILQVSFKTNNKPLF